VTKPLSTDAPKPPKEDGLTRMIMAVREGDVFMVGDVRFDVRYRTGNRMDLHVDAPVDAKIVLLSNGEVKIGKHHKIGTSVQR